MSQTKYEYLLSRKRTWTPTPVTATKLKEGGEDVIKRALSLRSLEIPVGDFINSAMKGDLPDSPGVLELLKSNVEDEQKHDLALNNAAKVHNIPARYEKEAQVITKQWVELDAHPCLKAKVLESSVFFVLLPIFRTLGDKGLRSVQQDIGRDEVVHVAANTQICNELKVSNKKALDNLRRATINWVVQSLQGEHSDVHLSGNWWTQRSDDLYAKGKTHEFNFTRVSVMPAFFEADNNDLPMYA